MKTNKNALGKSLSLLAFFVCVFALVAHAGTNYIGQIVQKVDGSGFTQPVSGTVNSVISGSTVSVVGLGGNAIVVDGSGVTQPVSGTFWQATQPVSGTFWQATQPISAAALPLPSGAATSAAQTTGNASLSSIDGKMASLGQTTMAGSMPVVIASNQSSFPVQYAASAAPSISTAAVAGTSKQIMASNATRKGIECEARCTNTSRVFINFGAGAATSDAKPLESCASWQPPAGVSMTAAIQVISASGTQDVLCVEY